MAGALYGGGGRARLSPIEILIIHSVRHRDRPKTLADLCLVLDIEDTHVANYAIKKLEAAGLVKSGKAGKEKTIRVTDRPDALEALYRNSRAAIG